MPVAEVRIGQAPAQPCRLIITNRREVDEARLEITHDDPVRVEVLEQGPDRCGRGLRRAGATLDGSSTLTVTIGDNDTSPPPSAGGGGGGGGPSDLVLLALLSGVLLARCAPRPRRPTPR